MREYKETIRSRLSHAWNAFLNRDPTDDGAYEDRGRGTTYRPDRIRLFIGNERSIITSIYNRIGIQVSGVSIQHVRLDQNGRYLETLKTGLNEALSLNTNVDQTGRAFIQDVVMSLCDEGCVAIVPVDTTLSPLDSGSYDIQTMRTAKILEWFPNHVRVRLYNEKTGNKEDITLPKNMVAIIENPFYAVMNEPNSTLKRLISKLNLLDAIDQQSGSGKLDLIIQLPYVIKTEARRQEAEKRRKDIESQLAGSKYGIAYTDGTEKVTQLNRAAENNLMTQIQYLTSMLYSQLGITESILNGTASEEELVNFFNHTIEPFLRAIIDEMKRKFLTKTARTQNQSIEYFRDSLKLIPPSKLAESADKYTRNEILTSNEIRSVIGYKPSSESGADELRNKNLNKEQNTNPESSDNKLKGEKDDEKTEV